MILFHGTSGSAILSIMQEGFKPGECSDFGTAVYLSDLREWAIEYANATGEGQIIEAVFTGNLLDLSIPEHFQIYRKTGNAIPNAYDALKDGHIIAVYNLETIQIISITSIE